METQLPYFVPLFVGKLDSRRSLSKNTRKYIKERSMCFLFGKKNNNNNLNSKKSLTTNGFQIKIGIIE